MSEERIFIDKEGKKHKLVGIALENRLAVEAANQAAGAKEEAKEAYINVKMGAALDFLGHSWKISERVRGEICQQIVLGGDVLAVDAAGNDVVLSNADAILLGKEINKVIIAARTVYKNA